MTRALGDLQYKQPLNTVEIDKEFESVAAQSSTHATEGDFMSRVPHLVTLTLSPSNQQILILATDGVCDVIGDEDLVKLVVALAEQGHSAQNITGAIIEMMAQRQNSDNCTCIVVFLGQQH